jgi:hypothetical protein
MNNKVYINFRVILILMHKFPNLQYIASYELYVKRNFDGCKVIFIDSFCELGTIIFIQCNRKIYK